MIEIVSYPAEPLPEKLKAILARQAGVPEEIEQTVRGILKQVREGGDAALSELSRRIEGVELEPGRFRVPREELEQAAQRLEPDLRAAVEAAEANIRAFHECQKVNSWFVEEADGVILGKKVGPVARVGLCVPGGRAPLLSSLLMAAVPAQVAGVREICVVSPPQPDGRPHEKLMGVAGLLGIDEMYSLGGAQAVAALAFGTETIRPVDKIVGPGSPYTVAAQQQVFGAVGVAVLPGPSEIVVLADAEADPRYVAADLLSQAEHGWGVASVCITSSCELAGRIQDEMASQVETLPDDELMRQALDAYGAVIVVPDLETGVELLNRLAPEHAELLVADPWAWLSEIRNAGAIFLGAASTEPVGDYFAGTNHILPTSGAARYASSLGVSDFLKTSSIVAYTGERLRKTGDQIVRLARAEGLEAHARAVWIRLAQYGRES